VSPAPTDPPADEGAAADDGAESNPLAELLLRAQTGLRSQVQPLAEALEEARLLVPLRKPMQNVELGVEVELDGELSLSPHLLMDADDLGYVVAFSHPDPVRPVAEQMGWQTGESELECCALPGRMALEVALELVDGEHVVGLLIDPMAETELMLQRHEIASLAQGKALPLVGYVAQIPPSPDEKTLIAELDEPPPASILAAIEDVIGRAEHKPVWKLKRTFNAERDLEPHWTLTFGGSEVTDELLALSEEVANALEGKLPPPGYIDVLFDEELGA
jgi:hypothetical protein